MNDGWLKINTFVDGLPSGELTFCHGKSPFLMGKSTISMAIFHCYVSSPEGNPSRHCFKRTHSSGLQPTGNRHVGYVTFWVCRVVCDGDQVPTGDSGMSNGYGMYGDWVLDRQKWSYLGNTGTPSCPTLTLFLDVFGICSLLAKAELFQSRMPHDATMCCHWIQMFTDLQASSTITGWWFHTWLDSFPCHKEGMSSETHWLWLIFFRGVAWNHQPDPQASSSIIPKGFQQVSTDFAKQARAMAETRREGRPRGASPGHRAVISRIFQEHVPLKLIWVNFITTEPCSPEPWESWFRFFGESSPESWPNNSG